MQFYQITMNEIKRNLDFNRSLYGEHTIGRMSVCVHPRSVYRVSIEIYTLLLYTLLLRNIVLLFKLIDSVCMSRRRRYAIACNLNDH